MSASHTEQQVVITARVEGLGGNSDDISWSSNNSNVAIIGQGHEAQVEAMSAGGSVTITATSNQDKSKQGFIQLAILTPLKSTVEKPNPPPTEFTVKQVIVKPKQLELDINSKAKLCSAVEGIGSINQTIDWSSSDSQIATVDSDGFVTAIAKGEVQIFATSKQNSNQSATATVKIPRDTNWFAIGVGSIITAGATVVGVPLPAAIALGSATATGIHNWHVVNPSSCN